jgi:hypothetical protein
MDEERDKEGKGRKKGIQIKRGMGGRERKVEGEREKNRYVKV